MKKNIIFLSLLMLSTSFMSFSQFNFGIKAGANYNINQGTSDTLNLKLSNAASFNLGAFVRIKIKKLSIQTEGLFNGRRGSFSLAGIEQNIDFNSFDLPILIGYKLIDLKVIKLRVNAGVIPSFFINSVGDLDKANFQDSFYSATVGLSLDIPLLIFDVRYQGLIGDFYDFSNLGSNTKLTNNLLTLSVGWKIM